jgi:hypothetical protein
MVQTRANILEGSTFKALHQIRSTNKTVVIALKTSFEGLEHLLAEWNFSFFYGTPWWFCVPNSLWKDEEVYSNSIHSVKLKVYYSENKIKRISSVFAKTN